MKFKGVILGAVMGLSALVTMPAMANPDTEEMVRMVKALKDRVEQLELQLAQQSRKVEQVATVAEEARESTSGSQFGGVEFHGVVEVEATGGDDHAGADDSDVTLATVELGFDFRAFDDWVTGTFTALHEDDDTDPWEVDVASITIGNTEEYPLYLSAGRMYVPFGDFETNLVSDTLALEIGETREAAIQLGFEKDNWYGSGYIFNGDVDGGTDDDIDEYGFNFGYAMEDDDSSFDVGVEWINNIGDSDGIEGTVAAPIKNYVAAYGVHGVYRSGPWSFMGEYITATNRFLVTELVWKAKGAEPSAYNLEVGYDFEAFGGRESNVAFAVQGTDESLALGLPEDKWLVGLSTTLYENTSLAIEYANAEDYSISDGGTGKDGDAVTLQVAVEF